MKYTVTYGLKDDPDFRCVEVKAKTITDAIKQVYIEEFICDPNVKNISKDEEKNLKAFEKMISKVEKGWR